MQRFLLSPLLLIAFSIGSCSVYYNAYIRNPTNNTAIVDVYLLQKQDVKTLPNQVKVANRVVDFKSGYRKHFDSVQTVEWITTEHFMLRLAPNTTADLTDMAGNFLNGSVMQDMVVTVMANGKTDTIINGWGQREHDVFEYRGMGFGRPVIYHNVR